MGYVRPSTVAVGVIVLLPLLLPNALLTIYIFIGLSTMVVSGLSLLMGFAGQVSLGQAAFYAIGAYTAGLLRAGPPLPPRARPADRAYHCRGDCVRRRSAALAPARTLPGVRHPGVSTHHV